MIQKIIEYIKAIKKIIIFIAKVMMLVVVFSMSVDLYFELNYFSITSYSIKEIDKVKPKTAAIVLGAAVYGNKPSAILLDRLKGALLLYKKKKIKKIILSGDNGKKYYNELTPMLTYMLKNKVKKEDIFIDYEGFRTYDSIVRAKLIFQVNDVVIVTQRFHQPRAAFIAEKLDMDVVCLETDMRTYKDDLKNRFREYFARNLAWMDVYFMEIPKSMGEVYSIKGSGEVTWKERDLIIHENDFGVFDREDP
jgi:SanA protein